MSVPSQEALQSRVLARMKELSDPASRWHRSLWTVACVTMLDELVESAEHTWSGLLKEHALNDFKKSALKVVAVDVGVGSETVRSKISDDIKKIKPLEDPEARNALSRVVEWRARVAKNYLRNWASHVESNLLTEATVELAARSVITHLRSLGYSRSHVQAWLKERGDMLSIAELAREAASNLGGAHRAYVFRVASTNLGRVAKWESALPSALILEGSNPYMSAENAKSFDLGDFAERRTVDFEISAPDPFAALTILQLRVERMMTRSALAEGKVQRAVYPVVLETTSNKLWRLRDTGKLLAIPALKQWKLITSLEDSPFAESLTETLHLLTPHLQSTHGISLATLWASCEALLGRRQQGGHLVASRLAAILVCAYPRHLAMDLLRRAKQLVAEGHVLSCRTVGHGTAALVAFCADLEKGDPGFTDPADHAAFYRYTAVVQDPRTLLKRVRTYLEELFLRVYYHRNFVMHSAGTSAVSLNDVSGLAPVLMAAALDEMVSGLARGISPHSLTERASIELELLGSDASKPILSLLT